MSSFLAPSTRAALVRLAELAEDQAAPPLERVRAIRRLVHELEADPAVLAGVREALDAGAGWDEIADAAGLKPAASRWRWSGTDEDIATRLAAGRKRGARPSSVPAELPGLSVAQAAATLGVTVQAVYLQVSRGKLASRTVELPDGRSYKRVFLDGVPADASTHTPTESTRHHTDDGGTDD